MVFVPEKVLFGGLVSGVSRCPKARYGRVCGQDFSNNLFNLMDPIRTVAVCKIEGIILDFGDLYTRFRYRKKSPHRTPAKLF